MKGKQLKKLLFIPLTAIAVCAFVATLSACDEKPVSDGSLKYELNSDGTAYTVTGVEKEEESFVIPAEYEGKPVTAIGDGAFWCCTPLKNVTVPWSGRRPPPGPGCPPGVPFPGCAGPGRSPPQSAPG